MVEVIKNQIEVYASVANLPLRKHPKARYKHPIVIAHFSILESWTRKRLFCNGPEQVVWNDNKTTFAKSFTTFVQIVFDKSASSLNGSTPVAHHVHAVPLNFCNASRRWLVQRRHTLVGFLPVKCVAELKCCNNKMVEMKESLYGFFRLQ